MPRLKAAGSIAAFYISASKMTPIWQAIAGRRLALAEIGYAMMSRRQRPQRHAHREAAVAMRKEFDVAAAKTCGAEYFVAVDIELNRQEI